MKTQLDPTALKIAKQRRFTLSARMLTGKAIDVTCINDANAPMACYAPKTQKLMLNEGDKRLDFSNPVKSLIYTRSCLYHEIDHALHRDAP